jgi:predicted Zn-dependent protease
MSGFTKISLVLCLLLLACKKEPYRYSVDARFNSVILEANKVIQANGIKLELIPSQTTSDIKFSTELCNGHTGEQQHCYLSVCDTTRTNKQMARTLLHEIGHCAGLQHVNDDKTNLMYPMNIDTATKLNKNQVNKINEGT